MVFHSFWTRFKTSLLIFSLYSEHISVVLYHVTGQIHDEEVLCFPLHYENTPIQIYRTFHLEKNESFQIKTQIFLIFLLKT